jgi:hypothetical protein
MSERRTPWGDVLHEIALAVSNSRLKLSVALFAGIAVWCGIQFSGAAFQAWGALFAAENVAVPPKTPPPIPEETPTPRLEFKVHFCWWSHRGAWDAEKPFRVTMRVLDGSEVVAEAEGTDNPDNYVRTSFTFIPGRTYVAELSAAAAGEKSVIRQTTFKLEAKPQVAVVLDEYGYMDARLAPAVGGVVFSDAKLTATTEELAPVVSAPAPKAALEELCIDSVELMGMNGDGVQPYVTLWNADAAETASSVRKKYSQYPLRTVQNSAADKNKFVETDDPHSFGFPHGLALQRGASTTLRAGFLVGDRKGTGDPLWGVFTKDVQAGVDGEWVGGFDDGPGVAVYSKFRVKYRWKRVSQ